MKRGNHGQLRAFDVQCAAHVEADAVEHLLLRHSRGDEAFRGAYDARQHGFGGLADFHGLPHMIRMIVGDQHRIRGARFLPGDWAGRIAVQERVHQQRDAAPCDFECRMAVPGNFRHGEFLRSFLTCRLSTAARLPRLPPAIFSIVSQIILKGKRIWNVAAMARQG